MGIFSVPISIGDNERRSWIDLSATVDTGALMMSVPGSLLHELGVAPVLNQSMRMADGSSRNMDIGYTWVRLDGREVMVHIVFNDEITTPLLGSLALETLLLAVDPVEERLVPLASIPL